MLTFLRRAPLVFICIFFIAGIIFKFEFSFSFPLIHYLIFALLAIVFALIFTKRFLLLQSVFILKIAFLLGMKTVSCFINQHTLHPQGKVQVDFRIEKKMRFNQYIAAEGNNRFLVELDKYDSLLPGNKVSALGEFIELQPPKLPWLFNQKQQMLSNGITHQLVVSRITNCSVGDENSIRFLPQKIQRELKNKITSAIKDTSSAAILSALLLGETSLLSKEVTADYSVAGVVHILAVSGMHVALIYELILFTLKIFLRKKRKWLTFFLAMSLLWGYGAITGFSASVVRACCMFSFFVISDCFLLSRNTGNTIAGSTLLILYFQPYLIFNLGFLLSLSAVLGIVVIHPLIMRYCYTENKIGYYLISSTSITLSATLTTLPITLYIFHSFPTYFVFANIILVPWSTLILYIGIAFLLLSSVPFIGHLITQVLNFSTSTMNEFIHLIHYLPKAQLSEINFNQEQLFLAYTLLFSLTLYTFFKWKHTLHITGIATLLFISYCYQTPARTGVLFTYYQSNILLFGTEKELYIACENDSLARKYSNKLNIWKCQQNRSKQEINFIRFPSYFSWKEEGKTLAFATFRSRHKAPLLLLNEELKMKKNDSTLTNEFRHEKLLLGKGVSRKKKDFILSHSKENNTPLQNIQSHPFILK